jgi:triacylglycerol lipase
MSLLGFIGTAARPPATPVEAVAEPQLSFEDVLVCGRRLWIRGRFIDLSRATETAARKSGRWRRKPAAPALLKTLHVETRIGSQSFENTLSPGNDGRFEIAVEANLPESRRGWRLVRNRVTCGEQTPLEKCCVAVLPPEDARKALVVLLPLACTMEAQGPQRLTRSAGAARLTSVLKQLRHTGDRDAIYYVACVPFGGVVTQSELALATATLGWPAGTFVLLPSTSDQAGQTILAALHRLRWLFAETFAMRVLNMETGFAGPLGTVTQIQEDGATLEQIVDPLDNPEKLLSGADSPSSAEAAPVRFVRPTLVPRSPVVFCHGMLAFSLLRMQIPEDSNCFSALREFLQARGFRTLYPQVAPTSGVVLRAGQLREQILRWTDEPVNLIAHSMGGLDARYMITHLGMAKHVRSLTTVSTPHRGNHLVDWFLTNYRQRVPLFLALEAAGVDVKGFSDCRPSACKAFNEQTPNMPGVAYFSYGGEVPVSRVTPPLRRAWHILSAAEGPNDGMVSLASARWGEYLGTVHADHFAQTPDMKFVHPHEDFDPLGFYLRILETLARRGF